MNNVRFNRHTGRIEYHYSKKIVLQTHFVFANKEEALSWVRQQASNGYRDFGFHIIKKG